jgi:hypothetical protein
VLLVIDVGRMTVHATARLLSRSSHAANARPSRSARLTSAGRSSPAPAGPPTLSRSRAIVCFSPYCWASVTVHRPPLGRSTGRSKQNVAVRSRVPLPASCGACGGVERERVCVAVRAVADEAPRAAVRRLGARAAGRHDLRRRAGLAPRGDDVAGRPPLGQRLRQRVDLLLRLAPLRRDVGRGQLKLRLVRVVQQREQAVVLCVTDRVVLVGVTLRARDRHAEPGRAGRADAVDHRVEPVLERVDPPLLVQHRVPVKAGGDALRRRGVGQQVAGQLLDRELVEGHVGVDRVDHPVAVRPDRPLAVLLVAVGVGVAGEVEPAAGPTLAVARAGEQAVDVTLVGVRRGVVCERVRLGRRRRQADQVE